MLYKFEKYWADLWYCVVEADSLEEAKEKAEDADWEKEYDDGADLILYSGFKPYLDEDEECPSFEEYDNGDAYIEWEEIEDDDFFSDLKQRSDSQIVK